MQRIIVSINFLILQTRLFVRIGAGGAGYITRFRNEASQTTHIHLNVNKEVRFSFTKYVQTDITLRTIILRTLACEMISFLSYTFYICCLISTLQPLLKCSKYTNVILLTNFTSTSTLDNLILYIC